MFILRNKQKNIEKTFRVAFCNEFFKDATKGRHRPRHMNRLRGMHNQQFLFQPFYVSFFGPLLLCVLIFCVKMFFNSTAQHKALLGETSFEMFSLLPFHGAQKKRDFTRLLNVRLFNLSSVN